MAGFDDSSRDQVNGREEKREANGYHESQFKGLSRDNGRQRDPSEETMARREEEGSTSAELTRSDVEEVNFRRESYLEFVTSIPRICSPTVCGTSNYHTPRMSSMSGIFGTEEDSKDFQFNWSIDQIALLNPCDFSSYENPSFLKDIDSEHFFKIDQENEDFFSQKVIIPSPSPRSPFPSMSESKLNEKFNLLRTSLHSPFLGSAKITPDKGLSDNAYRKVFDTKAQTPLNYSKSKQKKKLFEDDLRREAPKSELDSIDVFVSPIKMSFCSNNSTLQMDIETGMEFKLSEGFASLTRTHSMCGSIEFLSPIVSKSNDQNMQRVEEEKLVSTFEPAIVRTGEDKPQLVITVDSDSGCVDNCYNPFNRFIFKTSTPSHC